VALHGVHRVFDVAVAVVDIDQHRHVAGGDDVAYRRCDVGKSFESDVGYAVARTGNGEAAHEHGVKARALDEQRAECVIGTGNDEQSLFRHRLVERLAKAWARGHGNLLGRLLVSRFRSSHTRAAHSKANFGIKGTLATL